MVVNIQEGDKISNQLIHSTLKWKPRFWLIYRSRLVFIPLEKPLTKLLSLLLLKQNSINNSTNFLIDSFRSTDSDSLFFHSKYFFFDSFNILFSDGCFFPIKVDDSLHWLSRLLQQLPFLLKIDIFFFDFFLNVLILIIHAFQEPSNWTEQGFFCIIKHSFHLFHHLDFKVAKPILEYLDNILLGFVVWCVLFRQTFKKFYFIFCTVDYIILHCL